MKKFKRTVIKIDAEKNVDKVFEDSSKIFLINRFIIFLIYLILILYIKAER